METSYREIARSSLDTTVAETGYANEQLTGPRERRLYRPPAKITALRKLKSTQAHADSINVLYFVTGMCVWTHIGYRILRALEAFKRWKSRV